MKQWALVVVVGVGGVGVVGGAVRAMCRGVQQPCVVHTRVFARQVPLAAA